MKNYLRLTGRLLVDVILMIIVVTTLVTAFYGIVAGFYSGYPQKIDANRILLISLVIVLGYAVSYALIELRILHAKINELYEQIADSYRPKAKKKEGVSKV